MKILMIATTILTLFATESTWANDGSMTPSQKTTTEPNTHLFANVSNKDRIIAKVNGLVCDFCARALEKVFSKRDEVVGINVNLDKGEVLVAMKKGLTLDDKTLTELITDSGYNVVKIIRGSEHE